MTNIDDSRLDDSEARLGAQSGDSNGEKVSILPWEYPLDIDPMLGDYLAGTRNEIESTYKFRIEGKFELKFDEFWAQADEFMFNEAREKVRDARAIAMLCESRGVPDPAVKQSLELSIYYWLEANHAMLSRKDERRGWAALARCQHYLGIASAPPSANERKSWGGWVAAEGFQQLPSILEEILSEFEENQFPTLKDAMQVIVPRVQSIIPNRTPKTPSRLKARSEFLRDKKQIKLEHGKSDDPARQISEARRRIPVIRDLFKKIVATEIRRGAYKKDVGPAAQVD